ncbi:hypothetical protein BC940DRAFT_303767 [Gongronella butleri]|nr:hypothetical protein BC940DRAFT_303767 [Gongronella butleri]
MNHVSFAAMSSLNSHAVTRSFLSFSLKEQLYQCWLCIYAPLFWLIRRFYVEREQPRATAIESMISSIQLEWSSSDNDDNDDDDALNASVTPLDERTAFDFECPSPSGFSDTSCSSVGTPSTLSAAAIDDEDPESPKSLRVSIKKAWKRSFQRKRPSLSPEQPSSHPRPLDRRPSLSAFKSWSRRRPSTTTLPPPPPLSPLSDPALASTSPMDAYGRRRTLPEL